MSCDPEHSWPAETCPCDCGCDTIIDFRQDVCFACYHGEHQVIADFFYPDDEEDL